MNKLKLIVIGRDHGSLSTLVEALQENSRFEVARMETPEQVFSALAESPVDVVIIDEDVPGSSGLHVLRDLLKRNPFVNYALVSGLYPDEFHEATEGLGVFMQLPLNPGSQAAREVAAHLDKIYRFDSP